MLRDMGSLETCTPTASRGREAPARACGGRRNHRGTLPGAALLLRSAPSARERHVGLPPTSVPQHPPRTACVRWAVALPRARAPRLSRAGSSARPARASGIFERHRLCLAARGRAPLPKRLALAKFGGGVTWKVKDELAVLLERVARS